MFYTRLFHSFTTYLREDYVHNGLVNFTLFCNQSFVIYVRFYRFDPERFSPENESSLPPFAFEPFGFAGKRKCVGYRFALAEATTMLATILHSNLNLLLAPDQVVPSRADIVTFPSEELWVAVKQIKQS